MTPSPVPSHPRAIGRAYQRFAQQAPVGDIGEAFVARDRLHVVGPKAIDGVPALIVELLSPSTRRRDLGSKKAPYERFGVPE